MLFEGGQGLGKILKAGLPAEFIYSFAIIVCSLMIYFGTKEIYQLSSHKGIKYFRQAFLFFAFAYFFRSFLKIIIIYFNFHGIIQICPRFIIGSVLLFLFLYFGSMAVFYLLYSVLWKKLSHYTLYLFHLIAFMIAIFSVLLDNPFVYLGVNIILFVFILISVYILYKESRGKGKKKLNLCTIYFLLLFFWLLNIIDILIPAILQSFQIFIYIISLGIFLLILYKVLKKVGS